MKHLEIKLIISIFLIITNVYSQDSSQINSLLSQTIENRVVLPDHFRRIKVIDNSFSWYLRNLQLKPKGSRVFYYNGSQKYNQVHVAVVDMDIGNKDLQQCADAVIRLRAEYLFSQGKYDEIHFNFTNGFNCEYSKWKEGYRVIVEGNNCKWIKKYEPSNSYEDFLKYMETVFMYAGTISLSKELKSVNIKEMQIGDVFIQGGSPGHAVIVVDMAENETTGERIFLLAQSFMPAQDIHILKNPNNSGLNPWYSLSFGEVLVTPEWTFTKNDLKRFD